MTDDRRALREHLEAATGERVAATEALEPVAVPVVAPAREMGPEEEGKAMSDGIGTDVEKMHKPKEIEFGLEL